MENNNPLLTRVFPTNPVLVESGNPFCNPGTDGSWTGWNHHTCFKR